MTVHDDYIKTVTETIAIRINELVTLLPAIKNIKTVEDLKTASATLFDAEHGARMLSLRLYELCIGLIAVTDEPLTGLLNEE